MNTNIVISLDKRRVKKDESYPIIMRLSHKRKTIGIPLGVSIHENYWDEKKRLVRKSFKGISSVTRLNNLIAKKKGEAMNVIAKLEENDTLRFLSMNHPDPEGTGYRSRKAKL